MVRYYLCYVMPFTLSLFLTVKATKVFASSSAFYNSGHSYNINDKAEMEHTTQEDLEMIIQFINLLAKQLEQSEKHFDTSALHISIGSTPSMFFHKNSLNNNTLELHPGNYVFYDRQQMWTGACKREESVASFVLTRIIGHYPDTERNSIMVDAGATALTKETTPQGDVCAVLGHPELECYRMSQEVSMIRLRDQSSSFPFDDFALGSSLLLIPNHSCLSAACFSRYYVVDEKALCSTDAEVIDEWIPVSGWA